MWQIVLKDDEILIFTDFNRTFVDFENEYNNIVMNIYEDTARKPQAIKQIITRAIDDFIRKTGLKPVICVVTNASLNNVDANGFPGIMQDMKMTFFDHSHHTPEMAKRVYENSCEKYIKYLVYKENDIYFEINPLAGSMEEMFVPKRFSDEALAIRYIPQFRKKESVERILSMYNPESLKNKFMIFAGDSIKDDYPMALAETDESVGIIYVRPNKSTKMKPSVAKEFVETEGYEFTSVNPKNNKKLKNIDMQNISMLNDADRKALFGLGKGKYIVLAGKNSVGFAEGLKMAADIVASGKLKNPNGISFGE